MSFGISKTIPAAHGDWALDDLYGGKEGEFEFHMAGKPTRLKEGDFVYTIFKDELHGRCRIKRFKGGEVNPKSGAARTLIFVETPGEKLKKQLPMKGHRGTRYVDGDFWK